MFLLQKEATLRTPENQTNYKKLQNTKTIESKESHNKALQDASATKKKSQKDKQEENIVTIVRSLDSSCKKKGEKRKEEKNKMVW